MIFYIIFLSQIIFISWYVPKLMKKKMQDFSSKYPADQYPKLYHGSEQEYHDIIHKYVTYNNALLIIGLCVVCAGIVFNYLMNITLPALLPVLFFLLQMIPEIQLQSWAKHSLKLMRAHSKVTTRKAIIKPRKLFDFISPLFFSSALILLLGCLIVVFYAKGLQLRGIIIMSVIVAFNVYAAYAVYSYIYGKKLNPHQAYEDRIKEITIQVKKYFMISIILSTVIGVIGILRMYQLEFLEPSIISACIQLMVYATTWRGLKKLNMDEMDFSPYRVQNQC